MYSVSFLKKHTDGSYYWPKKEFICDVDDMDVLEMSIPSEDILSGKTAIVRVKVIVRFGLDKRCSQYLSRFHKKVCWVEEGPVTNLL